MESGWPKNPGREDSQGDQEKWVYDSSVDHKGRVPRRASTGAWRAALFVIAMEFSERLSYFGLSTNLIIYLTKVLHQEVKTAAKNVNYWVGVTTLMPLLGGFMADAYLGRFTTVTISTIIYLGGLSLLSMSQFIPSLKPCNIQTCKRSLRLHEIVFFVAMYMISVGTGGHKPSLESFGADQFDDNHAMERKKKMSYFNWWNCALCSGLLLGGTLLVYVEDKVSWGLADIVIASVMAIALVVFLAGRRFYRYRVPEGSPLTPMLQVAVAAMAKRHLDHPVDARELYEVSQSQKSKKRLLCHTNQLRFLDKAAIIEQKDAAIIEQKDAASSEKLNPWRLATVTQVEETKLILSMVPIWFVSLPFGLCVAQASTFFIKQGSIMNRKISSHFELPPASVYSLAAIGMIISVSFYDKLLVPFLRRATGNERGISILRRIGIGMFLSIIAMITAALVEKKRLRVAAVEQTPAVTMSVFWLVPQFVILGFGDGFSLVGLQEYFYDQVPDNMRSLGIAFYLSVLGAANFLSSLLITLVDHITSKGGRRSWFAKDLNKSRLDLFYWLLAAINAVNLCGYMYLASKYSYKSVQRKVGVDGSSEEDVESNAR
ncbi:protein NRT1/ PTR FAMILY 5.6-like [Typha angustifolia]|uniref:protein NRT1/ PTR FAMILY 5.6-like n=1 Tax=Typha angustifolia TaxID=59011 RepID=UPI003C2FB555